jgi:hypothetical protein
VQTLKLSVQIRMCACVRIFRCSSRSSVSEKHLMGPSMSVCMSHLSYRGKHPARLGVSSLCNNGNLLLLLILLLLLFLFLLLHSLVFAGLDTPLPPPPFHYITLSSPQEDRDCPTRGFDTHGARPLPGTASPWNSPK